MLFQNQVESWLASPGNLRSLRTALYPLARTGYVAVGYAPEEAADELLAEVCRIALSKAEFFEPDRSPDIRFYLLGIGRNVVRRWIEVAQKKKERIVSLSLGDTDSDSKSDFEPQLSRLLLQRNLQGITPSLENGVVDEEWITYLLEPLPPMYREILFRTLVQKQTTEEIANDLKIASGTVRVRLSRAYKAMRPLYEKAILSDHIAGKHMDDQQQRASR